MPVHFEIVGEMSDVRDVRRRIGNPRNSRAYAKLMDAGDGANAKELSMYGCAMAPLIWLKGEGGPQLEAVIRSSHASLPILPASLT